ncbi:MAG: hypothetical protein VX884_01745 [Pseudomonadota bacterium]|nr:hypothetical protein [Pseudomonadota bacterium]
MLRTLFLIVPFLFLVHVTSASALPPCPSDDDAYWDNCEGSYTWTSGPHSGDKYVGGWRDDKKHGHGTYYYLADNEFKGDTYVGEYRDDERYGQGTYTFAGEDKYVGEWKDDKYHGHGTFTWSRNAEEYVAGLPAAGSEYVGQWRDDTFDGYGTMFWANGEVWVGQFREWDMSSGNKYTAGNVPPEVYAGRDGGAPPISTSMDKAESKCEELGFTPKTEKYGDCVLKLLEMN